ncbi:MAG TPA: IS5 family transposase [Gemmatimonadales bacterium]|nr:IS5 family transposase [Gemmatimonadales bacterium]
MRGDDRQHGAMFSYLSPEDRVPPDHPLRAIRQLVDHALADLSPRFTRLYARLGRPSIPPEQLLRALLVQVLYTVRSERQLMEQLDYNILFRWFVGLNLDEPVWAVTVFTKNRERLLRGDVAEAFFQAVLGAAERAGLLSKEHFTVDGTLVKAWAGQKSFRPRHGRYRSPGDDDPGNPTVDFHRQPRSNVTHRSTTDPEARLIKRAPGQEARLAYQGHVLMDNRHGLAVATRVTAATGFAERETAVALVRAVRHRHQRITLGADKGYDARACITTLRAHAVTPHIARQLHRRSAVDDRTTRHPGYAISQRRRKRIEEIFGWLKTVGLQRQTRFRGVGRVGWMFTFATAVYNLVRMQRLLGAGGVA